jgi:hypothetical protein
MAITKSTKAAVLEVDTAEVEVTAKSVINEGIARVIEATGIDVQKNRYKAMRAIAFEAFAQAIKAGDFDALVNRAIANVDQLPSGWEIKAPVAVAPKPTPAKNVPVKKTAAR